VAEFKVRDMPDALHQKLKAMAADQHRSLNSQVLVILERAARFHEAHATGGRPSAPSELVARLEEIERGLFGEPGEPGE
jgi:plasmid stability protein